MTDARLSVDLQDALDDDSKDEPPAAQQINSWAHKAYAALREPLGLPAAEVTIRLVGEAEMVTLNSSYRNKEGSTNVLSFAFENDFELAAEIEPKLLGDIVLCHDVIVRESADQDKTIQDHYAHMITHGFLHLCGYDHQDNVSAEQMEALEIEILARSNVKNPYN